MTSIAWTNEDLAFIKNSILRFFPHSEIIFFGSRTKGTHQIGSDLDVCIRDSSPLSLSEWAKLDEVFSNSDLPYKVDISDWNRISTEFQKVIQTTGRII